MENSLSSVTSKEETVAAPAAKRRKKSELGDADILSFIDNREVEGRCRPLTEVRGQVSGELAEIAVRT